MSRLQSNSDCLTAGTKRSSPKMSFTHPFGFLDLKKKKKSFLFSFRQSWQQSYFSCTGCLPNVCRLCAAVDKDCAIGNFFTMKCQTHYTIYCRKDFWILVCFQVLYISSRYGIVFVCFCFFKYPFGPRKVYTLFVIL